MIILDTVANLDDDCLMVTLDVNILINYTIKIFKFSYLTDLTRIFSNISKELKDNGFFDVENDCFKFQVHVKSIEFDSRDW